MYCPTDIMLADYFTKPLQGNLFKFYKEIVMGWVPPKDIISAAVEMKERVGKSAKYDEKLISNISRDIYSENTADAPKSWADVVKNRDVQSKK